MKARLAASAGVLALVAWAYHYMDLLGDSFWYAATGRWILAHHAMPDHDPFAFTTNGIPWVVHMPLSQIVFGWTTSHLGLHALLLLASVVFGGAVAAVWLAGARGPAARLATLPIALFAVWLQRDDLAARGQVFADVFFVAVLLLVQRCRRAPPRLAVVGIAGVVIAAVWLGLHPSGVIAPALPLGYGLALFAEPRVKRETLRALVVLAAGLALGLFLSPLGGPALVFDTARMTQATSTFQIDLFRSPDLRDPGVLVMLALGVFVALGSRRADALFLAVWILASLLGRRHLETLSLTTLLFAGRIATRARLERRIPHAATILLAGGVVISGLAYTWKDPLQNSPDDAAAFIVSHHLPGNVINPYHWGGYLAYAWDGAPRVFIDGRIQLFDRTGVFDDHSTIARGDASSRALLDTYEINTVLWENGAPLDAMLSQDPAWEPAMRGRLAVVYVRRPKH